MNAWWYVHSATLYQLSSRWARDDIYIPQLYINFPADEQWWYIHTETLYQLSCRWKRDDIYVPQLYINFPADEQLMIYTYRNFISTFLQMNTWWYIHTATLYQLSWRQTPEDIYIPPLYINFPADDHLRIYTSPNFISIFQQMNRWWYIHTVSLYQLSCRWTRDDIYIPRLYINFPADEQQMIYTYCNFISTFLQMNTWWYIHPETLYQFSCSCTRDDIYILQLYINFPTDNNMMIYTYRKCISIFLQLNTWWYIHTASLYQFSCRWTRDDIYIPQLYINFPADEHVMIFTYRNFILTFLQIITWWYIHTATGYQFSCSWTPHDIYIPQLYINFLAVEHVMIYTYRHFVSIFQQINRWWYIHTATLFQLSFSWAADDIYVPKLYINFPADKRDIISRYRNFMSTFLQMNTWWYIHTITLYQFPCR